jgi:hypothetical protein
LASDDDEEDQEAKNEKLPEDEDHRIQVQDTELVDEKDGWLPAVTEHPMESFKIST